MNYISKVRTFAIVSVLSVMFLSLVGCEQTDPNEPTDYISQYAKATYAGNLYTGQLTVAGDYCVAEDDVLIEGFKDDRSVHGAGLFDIANSNVIYSYNIHKKLYPASTTKIMTALLCLEKGNLEDEVVISKTASAASFPIEAQVCGLVEGEKWKLNDLLNALMLYSGNDAATAIAEHIAGTQEEFVAMMNQRAHELFANNTHFTNPHGLHNSKHYTTAYDLYLIFNECIKDERFVNIISSNSYTANYVAANGTEKTAVFQPTNLYARGEAKAPENVIVVGGKTGTTGEAGYCLILLDRNQAEKPFVSIVMGGSTKSALYRNMTNMMGLIPQE